MTAKSDRKEGSRERILRSAGSLIKENGIAGTSVAGVMDGAGMTVGGFYAHFPSKRRLVVETLRSSFREARSTLLAGLEDKGGREWTEAVGCRYLSRAHRDAPGHGCPLPGTLAEIARDGQEMRDALSLELNDFIAEMEPELAEAGFASPRNEALAELSLMVGGLTLARAVKGTALSDELLLACRRQIRKQLESTAGLTSTE